MKSQEYMHKSVELICDMVQRRSNDRILPGSVTKSMGGCKISFGFNGRSVFVDMSWEHFENIDILNENVDLVLATLLGNTSAKPFENSKSVHAQFRELAEKVYNDTGQRVDSVRFEWLVTRSGTGSTADHVVKNVNLASKSRGHDG